MPIIFGVSTSHRVDDITQSYSAKLYDKIIPKKGDF